MPRGDRTGPMGMGPMTGRGMGCCAAGATSAGYPNTGFGMGRGRRRMFHKTGLPGWARYDSQGTMPDADEKEILQNQAGFLEKQLREVRERLKSYEKDE